MANPNRLCETCKRRKKPSEFRLLRRKPPEYSKDCLLCLHEKKVPDSPEMRAKAAVELDAEMEYTREIAARELARRRLLHFIMRFEREYMAGWVHKDICARLERFMKAVERGEEPRLMLFLPPRTGKSLIASNYFPSWALGHHPDWEIIAASYAVTLPIGFSRRIRTRLRDRMYQAIFPKTALDPESQGIEQWNTTKNGGFNAVGVGGGLTGKGCRILILDDLLKDAEEADSETIREKVWDWVGSTAWTRLAPGGGVILIMTRWNDADPAGKFLDQDKELREAGVDPAELENWEVVSYPAIAENDEYLTPDHRIVDQPAEDRTLIRRKGAALHPERFSLPSLLKKKRTLQPRHWSALYQQNPVPEEGIIFQKDYLRSYIPPFDFSDGSYVHLLAGDLAISKSTSANYTVLGVGAMDSNGDIYLREVLRDRMDTFEIVENLVVLWKRYGCYLAGIEQGPIWQAVWPVLDRYMRKEQVIITFDEELKPITDKILRARPLQGLMQQGRVRFPEGQGWVTSCVRELLRFPGGANDDFVDMLAWMARMSARVPLPKPKKRKLVLKSWRDRLRGMGRDDPNWRAA